MIEKFNEYLNILPLTQVFKDRVNKVLLLNAKILNVEILDIFICDMKNSEGSKEYTSLLLFTDQLLVECKNFLSQDDFDITPYQNKISYCSIAPINFDFDTCTDQSSVRIHCRLGDMALNIIATDVNCNEAFKIYQKYIVANLECH